MAIDPFWTRSGIVHQCFAAANTQSTPSGGFGKETGFLNYNFEGVFFYQGNIHQSNIYQGNIHQGNVAAPSVSGDGSSTQQAYRPGGGGNIVITNGGAMPGSRGGDGRPRG